MGNYISCATAGPISVSSVRPTKVIFPSGETRRLYEPTKAAELMLESPNCFIASSKSLHAGRRFSPLSADEDLEIGGVYVFFPMARLRSAVTAADVGALFRAANSSAKRTARVFAECGGDQRVERGSAECSVAAPELKLDVDEEFSAAELRRRLYMCRSRKPLLETIAEESVLN